MLLKLKSLKLCLGLCGMIYIYNKGEEHLIDIE